MELITEAKLYEFGPVDHPVNPHATIEVIYEDDQGQREEG